MYCRSHQGGSEPLPRVRLQPGTGQDSSTFILLLYLFRSMGLLPHLRRKLRRRDADALVGGGPLSSCYCKSYFCELGVLGCVSFVGRSVVLLFV